MKKKTKDGKVLTPIGFAPKTVMRYPCDPGKNTRCGKDFCFINGGPCSTTMHPEYKKEGGAS